MIDNTDFYVFEVLEDYKDKFTFKACGEFEKGERFIGWSSEEFEHLAFKSNMGEPVCIHTDKVKKIYKIRFEELNSDVTTIDNEQRFFIKDSLQYELVNLKLKRSKFDDVSIFDNIYGERVKYIRKLIKHLS